MFKIFGISINLGQLATGVLTSLTWLMLSAGIKWIHDLNTSLKETLPGVVQDVKSIKIEQARVKKEYHPETENK